MEPLQSFLVILITSLAASTLLYLFLRRKTRIGSRYLWSDNPAVAIISAFAVFIVIRPHISGKWLFTGIVLVFLVIFLAFVMTMIRFFRVPRRRVSAGPGQIVSPADGRIIYIKKLTEREVPESVKKQKVSRLEELTKTSLLNDGGWHIGINMTPFDVHKNCAPISGEVILNRHFSGKFLSLKDEASQSENERNTCVVANEGVKIGIVQIASRLVRRIDSYVSEGEKVKQGDWIGMIRFGSQVDVIIPADFRVITETGRQVYAAETIIAEKNEDTD
ncbi:MAG: phosphatidylserine decarboxylase family protein [Methanomicrobiales archaeon]|jgi:phosphatidylserine decarboxylase|nr:phosphatidylserine decarboxylase family protein [Methanomicrobiales archaeon]